jgi:hypothetical protein
MTQCTPKTGDGGAAKNDHNLRVHLALSPASGCYTPLTLSRGRHVLLLLLLLRLWMTLRVLLLLLLLILNG